MMNLLVNPYRHVVISGETMGSWLMQFTWDVDEDHEITHYMIHICLCFNFLNGPYMSEIEFELLVRVFFSFYENRFEDMGNDFVYALYHYSVGRYGTQFQETLSQQYFDEVTSVYHMVRNTNGPSRIFYFLDPDLDVEVCPYPFVRPYQQVETDSEEEVNTPPQPRSV